MKPKIGREITLLMLPFAVIAGAAWWKSRQPVPLAVPVPTPAPFVAPLVGRAARFAMPPQRGVVAHVDFGMVRLRRLGPVAGQNVWSDQDFLLDMPVGARNLMFQSARSGQTPNTRFDVPQSPVQNLRLQAVQLQPWVLSAGASPVKSQPFLGLRMGTVPFGSYRQAPFPSQTGVPDVTFHGRISTGFDLDRVAAGLGPLHLGTTFTSPDEGVHSLRIAVRPAWFTRSPRTLTLVSAKNREPEDGDDGSVIVTVRSARSVPLIVRNAPLGSEVSWGRVPNLGAKAGQEVFGLPELLYNWSPRFESADGSYNSHAARDAFGWERYRARAGAGAGAGAGAAPGPAAPPPMSEELAAFSPRIETQTPQQNGPLTTIRFRFYGLSSAPQARIFATEIGVPGDGFLRVRVALPGEESP